MRETIDATLNRVSSSGVQGASYFSGSINAIQRDADGASPHPHPNPNSNFSGSIATQSSATPTMRPPRGQHARARARRVACGPERHGHRCMWPSLLTA